jgi:hypothetical protein
VKFEIGKQNFVALGAFVYHAYFKQEIHPVSTCGPVTLLQMISELVRTKMSFHARDITLLVHMLLLKMFFAYDRVFLSQNPGTTSWEVMTAVGAPISTLFR